MTPEQFVYWLQGFFELAGDTAFTKRETIIKDHLKEVFHKKTPDYGSLPQFPLEHLKQGQTSQPPFPPQTQIIC